MHKALHQLKFIGSSVRSMGRNIMSKRMVRRWCRQFSEGRQSVLDEERSGRPSLINDDRVKLVRQCIMENRRFTITELSSHFLQISRSLLHEIVTNNLLFKKVCARWVPKNLTPEHKMQRLGAALTFLQRYHDDGDGFLDRIVTGDETWISHFTPETKQQSMHWWHNGSPVRTKFKQTLSVRKVMCKVFWDRKGILLIDFLPRGGTVNDDRYCETLRKLRRAIQNKRRGMLTAGVVLLHDNARPHTTRRTAAVLTEFGWELFDHPPYSPDLAPSDFHVFLHFKKFLSSGERFGNDKS
ncbi:histone-lysine N-methyltransferase SETMAR-like isoform X2 [Periplaneta americana]|uniref:histone-lysine N-methyltransferase SETMAR-like isoform X2 n=1 Tax=Periplaneta americana TaxID=6978 RepID=UPI0037E91A7C